MKLLIDPALLLPDARKPAALIERFGIVETVYGWQDADPNTNGLLHHHTWQLVDDGNVLDCDRTP